MNLEKLLSEKGIKYWTVYFVVNLTLISLLLIFAFLDIATLLLTVFLIFSVWNITVVHYA